MGVSLAEVLAGLRALAEREGSAVATLRRGLTVRVRRGPGTRWNIAAERPNCAPGDVEMDILVEAFGGREIERGEDGERRKWVEVDDG